MLGARQPIGPRELARRLSLSSHSVAIYHLSRLIKYGLVEKTPDGDYQVRADADLGFLDNFLYVRFRAFPRTLIYASFITGLLVFYTLFVGIDYTVHSAFALATGLFAGIFLWSEVYRIWKGLV